MYHTYENNGKTYVYWGKPESKDVTNVKKVEFTTYDGKDRPEDMIFVMPGNSACGLGDSVWMLSFLRDIFKIKCHWKCKLKIISSEPICQFYKIFFPYAEYQTEVTLEEFNSFKNHLPSMFFWAEGDNADRSWVDNQSILSRLYKWTGMKYQGIPDWHDFTPNEILNPGDDFHDNLGGLVDLTKPYLLFQWHSSGPTKNLPIHTNIKLLRHIAKNYGRVYVIGRLRNLDHLNEIPNVTNLSGKTEGRVQDLFTLASKAEFCICPDSGLLHLSEAYKVPCVCLLSSTVPSFIAKDYQMPAFMYGSGYCSHKPCMQLRTMPTVNCPPGTKYCRVMEDVDVKQFDLCMEQSYNNRLRYRSMPAEPILTFNKPITLGG